MTINSLLQLRDELHSKYKVSYMLTNRLNQDAAENLFCVIRSKGGFRDNPCAREFRAAFRHVVFDKFMSLPGTGNCAIDMDRVSLDLTCFERQETSNNSSTASNINNTNNISDAGENNNIVMHDPYKIPGIDMVDVFTPPPDIAKQNVSAYISGYLLRKLKFDCETCRQQLILTNLPDEEKYTFLRHKSYSEYCGLIYPSSSLVNFVEKLEQTFTFAFEGCMHMHHVLSRLIKNTEHHDLEWMLCNSQTCIGKMHGIRQLYMKIRLHHALKMSNREDKNKGKRNRKYLKLTHQ